MKVYIASQNAGKISEYEKLLAPNILCQCDIDVEETGMSFVENALLKARACAQDNEKGIYIGDDSGIMIDALNGMPGIRSKRWNGALNVHEAIVNVLDDLEGKKGDLVAKMVCCIALLTHKNDPLPMFFTGICEGVFIKQPRGKHGFAYDPYFLIPDLKKTNAELTPDEKNQISHRAKAARLLKDYLLSL